MVDCRNSLPVVAENESSNVAAEIGEEDGRFENVILKLFDVFRHSLGFESAEELHKCTPVIKDFFEAEVRPVLDQSERPISKDEFMERALKKLGEHGPDAQKYTKEREGLKYTDKARGPEIESHMVQHMTGNHVVQRRDGYGSSHSQSCTSTFAIFPFLGNELEQWNSYRKN